ncbi:preprotein translocase subunit SecE [Poriferisphaera corsica]|uniref:Protein translocase subunit SecE n=1 Tax=Poriferisphaera corsica TaxID=2528020 RepID=A0A517YQS5_9BACT|nr:preprotein translocase subunit SecE [Poriferisphaera corsica]QDU32570.1 preprotein translocase subunit SecE [Poriferisphaera corsica]
MAFKIYKPGEGYWTRTLTWIGAGTLVLSGILYIWKQMDIIQQNTIYWQGGMALAMVAFWGILLFWIMNKPNVAEFMIATEAEMKKVNWPSRMEVYGSTIVVIGGTFLLAAILFLINISFAWIFTQIGVLQS